MVERYHRYKKLFPLKKRVFVIYNIFFIIYVFNMAYIKEEDMAEWIEEFIKNQISTGKTNEEKEEILYLFQDAPLDFFDTDKEVLDFFYKYHISICDHCDGYVGFKGGLLELIHDYVEYILKAYSGIM